MKEAAACASHTPRSTLSTDVRYLVELALDTGGGHRWRIDDERFVIFALFGEGGLRLTQPRPLSDFRRGHISESPQPNSEGLLNVFQAGAQSDVRHAQLDHFVFAAHRRAIDRAVKTPCGNENSAAVFDDEGMMIAQPDADGLDLRACLA